MGRRAVAATLVLLALGGSARAAEPQVVPASRGLPADPAFANSRVVYITRRVGHRIPVTFRETLRTLAAGGSPHILSRWNAKVAGRRAAIAASRNRLLLATATPACGDDADCSTRLTSYYAGTADGRPKLLDRCRGAGFFGRSDEIAISGTIAAHLGCARHSVIASPVVVRDVEHPEAAPRTLRAPRPWDGFDSVRLAGRFLAARATRDYSPDDEDAIDQQNEVLVYDAVSGAKLYAITGATQGFDIQADGKLVVSQHDPDFNAPGSPSCVAPVLPLTWYSPAEPFAHRLPYRACRAPVRIADDRIAFHGPGVGTLPALTLTGINGSPLLPLSEPAIGQRPFAFDGERTAYEERRCVGAELVVDSVTRVRASGHRNPEACPVHFNGRVRQRRDGTLLIPVRCRRGCTGFWNLTLPGHAHDFYGLAFEVGRQSRKRTLTVRDELIRPFDPLDSIVSKRMTVTLGVIKPDGTQADIERQTIRARISRGRLATVD